MAEEKAPETINIKVRTMRGEEVHFRVKPHTTMEKVLNAFCEKVGVRRDIVRLTFDGTRVQLDHTPAKLGLEDGDALDVMEQQVGGAC